MLIIHKITVSFWYHSLQIITSLNKTTTPLNDTGVEKNENEAIKWYIESARRRYGPAMEKLEELNINY